MIFILSMSFHSLNIIEKHVPIQSGKYWGRYLKQVVEHTHTHTKYEKDLILY